MSNDDSLLYVNASDCVGSLARECPAQHALLHRLAEGFGIELKDVAASMLKDFAVNKPSDEVRNAPRDQQLAPYFVAAAVERIQEMAKDNPRRISIVR